MSTDVSLQPFSRQASLQRSVWFGANLISVLADGADTGGVLAVMEIAGRAGSEPPPHTHLHDDSLFYVLDGSVEYVVGAETVRANRGDAIFLPRGVEHAYRAVTTEFHALLLTSPSGLEEGFREAGSPARRMEINAHLPPPSQETLKSVFGARGIAFRAPYLAALSTRPNSKLARRPSPNRSRIYMGHLMTPLVTADDSTQFSLLEFKGRAGNEPPRHVHRNEDELLYLLDGEMTFDIGGKILHAFPGSLVFMPRGLPHSFKIVSRTARGLVVMTPSGLEQYYLEHSTPTDSLAIPSGSGNSYSLATVADACERYQFEIVAADFQGSPESVAVH